MVLHYDKILDFGIKVLNRDFDKSKTDVQLLQNVEQPVSELKKLLNNDQ